MQRKIDSILLFKDLKKNLNDEKLLYSNLNLIEEYKKNNFYLFKN